MQMKEAIEIAVACLIGPTIIGLTFLVFHIVGVGV